MLLNVSWYDKNIADARDIEWRYTKKKTGCSTEHDHGFTQNEENK